ncbi:3-hydroxyacyl-CoA dehydrogenase NAD-binding domain-containing protein, partial [Hoeflea sp.]|uniref:3-hydroxyacyl-CoA dehydrogenase NAD-binding domain-containing protein n=1 Tax=Hoeflea sp. TaxID=1940281 RepID=UPI00198EC19D
MSVRTDIADDIALITIDNPPLNMMSIAVRKALVAALDAAEAETVYRVIVAGSGGTFVAGADVEEFDAPAVASLPEIIARLEAFPVPVIAAINGSALGAGLELALGCRMRIAAPGATFSFPEVLLGLVPGAGGTQRLPRLIGIGPALELVAQGRTIRSDAAIKLGLVDAVEADPVAAARKIAPSILIRYPVISARPAPTVDDDAVTRAFAIASRKQCGQVAPPRAIALVADSARLSMAEGLAAERRAFLELLGSEQNLALQHVFLAERGATARSKAHGAASRPVATAVVVGGGTMGAGIAHALDAIGIRVTLVEMNEAAAARARANVTRLFDDAVKRGKARAGSAGEAGISVVVGYEGLPAADIAIEAVFEDLAVKRQVFAALDAALPETAILATNTSYLDPNRLAEGLRSPQRFVGLHFFSPAHVMKLVEVIRARATAPETLARVLGLATRLGKLPVLAGVCDGFIGNRILTRYRQACDVMLIEGALPDQVDAALRDFGMAMGPYEVQDLSGLDIAHANRKRLGWRDNPAIRYIPIADRIVEETGRLGRKTGAGWYDYGSSGQTPSPRINALVEAESSRAGITRRSFAPDEIVTRAMAAMASEGLAILQEGIADSPADIDLVLIHGYGFPRWCGGPMHMAERAGLPTLLARLERLAAEDPLS